MSTATLVADLLEIMRRLRTPETGCPWDLEQDFRSIAPYAIEEAHEVVDAIEREDFDDLADELGDLLLQVVFHAQMATERSLFDFDEVVKRINNKMIRRHPHVFSQASAANSDEVGKTWAAIKAQEKTERAHRRGEDPRGAHSLLADIPVGLPALTRAVLLQKRASSVGFDWNDPRKVIDKLREETAEVEEALSANDQAGIADEIGDMFFVLANLARHVGVDPEQAARDANRKFERRFGHIERRVEEDGLRLSEVGLERMEALWSEAKQQERP